jgi:hypothetical protein
LFIGLAPGLTIWLRVRTISKKCITLLSLSTFALFCSWIKLINISTFFSIFKVSYGCSYLLNKFYCSPVYDYNYDCAIMWRLCLIFFWKLFWLKNILLYLNCPLFIHQKTLKIWKSKKVVAVNFFFDPNHFFHICTVKAA